jgi:acetyl-CoA carboxylase biotin carboxyl carrier protein
MIDRDLIESLIRALDQSSLDSIEIERGGTRIRLSKTPPPAPIVGMSAPAGERPAPAATQTPAVVTEGGQAQPGAAAAAAPSNLIDVKSPMVGTFYRSAAPDAPSYVDKGTQVSKGDTLCIIEAMKLMNELESEVEGRVVEILAENNQPVEYGQVLFRIDPT